LKPHKFFKRDEAHINCRVPVPMVTAALGGQVEVPVIDGGKVKMNIPAGTQSGTQMRLAGKGMSILRSQNRGDMFIDIHVEIPVNLSKKQQELLKQFGGLVDEKKNNPESQGFFAKVKDLWEDIKDGK
jgi:molecular chaperone DnaJ